MNNIYYTMVLPTPKQMIKLLSEYNGIVLGAIDKLNIKGLSNDFYVQLVLDKVMEEIPMLHYAYKAINSNRTLWLITLHKNKITKEDYKFKHLL